MRGVSGGACTCVQAFCPPSFVARAALFSRFYRIAVSGSSANCFLRESCTRERERVAPSSSSCASQTRLRPLSTGLRCLVFGGAEFSWPPSLHPPLSLSATNLLRIFARMAGLRVFDGEERSRSSRNGNCFQELFVIVRNGGMRDSMLMRRGGSEFN